jgi:hypothetical protein
VQSYAEKRIFYARFSIKENFYITFVVILNNLLDVMLSILIPTNNYDCLAFVTELRRQAEDLPFPIEILVGGEHAESAHNQKINMLRGAKFIEINRNPYSHSYVCRCLARTARYNLLLFVGSEAGLVSTTFLKDYIVNFHGNEVLYGGCCYDKPMPAYHLSLHWTYGVEIDEKRNLFSSFNCLIEKKMYSKLFLQNNVPQFDFGENLYDLLIYNIFIKNDIHVRYIKNPLYYLGLKSNETFLSETESNVRQLIPYVPDLKVETLLLVTYHKWKSHHCTIFLCFFYHFTWKIMKNNLLGLKPSIKVFEFYKLSYFCNQIRKLGIRIE